MRRLLFCLLLLAPSVPARTAFAQSGAPSSAPSGDADLDAARRSIGDALSFATFGMVNALGSDAQVTRVGDDYHIRLPVTGVTAPTEPVVTATAKPAGDGAWDVTSLSFPSTATVDPKGPAGGRVTYTIGQQDITAHIAPGLARKSTYAATLNDIRLDTEAGRPSGKDAIRQVARQTIARYAVKGTMQADDKGRMAMSSQAEAHDWRMSATPRPGSGFDMESKRVAIAFQVDGLDREKGERLRERLHTLLQQAPTPAASSPATPSGRPDNAATRQVLNAVLDDLSGLLASVQIDETLEGVTLNGGQGFSATAGSVVIATHGGTVGDDFDASLDLAINDMATTTAMAGPYGAYVPRHISLRNRFHSLPARQLMGLLRAALAPGANPADLQHQASLLLGTPGAAVSIDPFSFDSGPLNVSGSAHLLPSDKGGFAGHLRIIASGLDTLITQLQGNPAFARVLPVLYMAKGMSKPDGASVAWDIDLDQGGVRINGTPFGHPPARR